MKVLVTGASGFLGQAVVKAAVAAGHDVVALVRPTANTAGLGWGDRVRIVKGDLRQRGDWRDQFGDAEAVVHLAATPSGDLAQQFSGTVLSTENLLESLDLPALHRFVHISSFSVYDYSAPRAGTAIDENTPQESQADKRDAYTITKIFQERLVREACTAAATPHVILRPGAIYGPGKTWDFGSAMRVGRFDIVFAPLAKFGVTFVDNCADAIVRAIVAPAAAGRVLNIVDDDLPTHAGYRALYKAAGAPVGHAVYVPWLAVATIGLAVRLLDRVAFGGRAKLPEFLALRRQQARWRPFAYPNAAAKTALDWAPQTTHKQAVAMIVAAGQDRSTPR